MLRKVLLSVTLLSTGMIIAAPLTPEQALKRIDNSGLKIETRGVSSIVPLMTLSTYTGEPSVYVFENAGDKGFMVVSADDALIPVLGYSDNNDFDPEDIPAPMKAWLDQYSRQVEYAREQGTTRSGEVFDTRVNLPKWSAISPLLKTTWNQNAPYNNDCPLNPLNRKESTPTGCVATSMSQVMNYFKYPEKGQNSISYNNGVNGTLSIDFSQITFDWANMLDSYTGSYTQQQADAVAKLMQAAGYSVQMVYQPNFSGAISAYIPGALYKYFNYDKDVTYVSRSFCTYTEWATLIYNNLKNVGPVIYDGSTQASEGHSYVCDGYDGNGYFHFNWGWGGAGDGYFLLDSLDPSSIGIGGAVGGFDFNQDIVLNIRKPQGDNNNAPEGEIVLSGSVQGSITTNYLYMEVHDNEFTGLRYYGLESMTFDIGLGFTPVDGKGETIYKEASNNKAWLNANPPIMPLDPAGVVFFGPYYDSTTGQYLNLAYPMFALPSLGLSDKVKYKASCAVKPHGQDNWVEVPAAVGCYNYFYITKNGDKYSIENKDVMQFDCKKLELNTGLYYNKAVEVSMTIANENDTELTRSAIFVLIDPMTEEIAFMGDSLVESLSPGETKDVTLVTNLTQQNGSSFLKATEYYPGLYDLDTETVYYTSKQTVKMQQNPGRAVFSLSTWIDNGEIVKDEEGKEQYSIPVYSVENSQEIDLSVEIAVTSGIFSSDVTVYGGYVTFDDNGNGTVTYTMTYPLDLTIINEGETYTYQTSINYSSAEPEELYSLLVNVGSAGNPEAREQIGFIAKTNQTGVDRLAMPEINLIFIRDKANGKLNVKSSNGLGSIETYSLNGMKLATEVSYYGDEAVVDLSNLGKGIIVVTATDGTGTRKSIKLVL